MIKMNELQNKAIAKLDAEIEKEKRNRAIAVIGEYLINLATAHPEVAEKLADTNKTLAGAYDAMYKEARKKQYNHCAVLTDEEGFEIVCEYFGIDYQPSGMDKTRKPMMPPVETAAVLNIELDDLLK